VKFIVHYLNHGITACAIQGPPGDWPPGHRWSSSWDDVTCEECLLGRDEIKTFTIAADGKSITCLRCKKTSYNVNDLKNHYCGFCHVFHDDLVPWARRWWMNLPPDQRRCLKPSMYQGERVSCQLRDGHAGYHKGIATDGRILKWEFGRHQTCHFILDEETK
jgi:ribosomal protein L37E